MRGTSLTPVYGPGDLSLIFFKIRTTRDRSTRRSLQRRARIALAQVTGLTDAERHEIASVWAQRDLTNIDSPALRKLLGDRRAAHDWETIPAKRFTRRSTDVKKPGRTRRDAANDAQFTSQGLQLSLVFYGT